MHPQLNADYAAVRLEELRHRAITEVPTHWRVRHKRHPLRRLLRAGTLLRLASQACEGSAS